MMIFHEENNNQSTKKKPKQSKNSAFGLTKNIFFYKYIWYIYIKQIYTHIIIVEV